MKAKYFVIIMVCFSLEISDSEKTSLEPDHYEAAQACGEKGEITSIFFCLFASDLLVFSKVYFFIITKDFMISEILTIHRCIHVLVEEIARYGL